MTDLLSFPQLVEALEQKWTALRQEEARLSASGVADVHLLREKGFEFLEHGKHAELFSQAEYVPFLALNKEMHTAAREVMARTPYAELVEVNDQLGLKIVTKNPIEVGTETAKRGDVIQLKSGAHLVPLDLTPLPELVQKHAVAVQAVDNQMDKIRQSTLQTTDEAVRQDWERFWEQMTARHQREGGVLNLGLEPGSEVEIYNDLLEQQRTLERQINHRTGFPVSWGEKGCTLVTKEGKEIPILAEHLHDMPDIFAPAKVLGKVAEPVAAVSHSYSSGGYSGSLSTLEKQAEKTAAHGGKGWVVALGVGAAAAVGAGLWAFSRPKPKAKSPRSDDTAFKSDADVAVGAMNKISAQDRTAATDATQIER